MSRSVQDWGRKPLSRGSELLPVLSRICRFMPAESIGAAMAAACGIPISAAAIRLLFSGRPSPWDCSQLQQPDQGDQIQNRCRRHGRCVIEAIAVFALFVAPTSLRCSSPPEPQPFVVALGG